VKFIDKLIGFLAVSIVMLYLLIFTGAGIYNMAMTSPYMGDDFLSTNEFSIPLGQIVAYVFFNTICFFLRRYKLGLMISFAFVFYWGFLHASANFVDEMGKPTLGLFLVGECPLWVVCGLTLSRSKGQQPANSGHSAEESSR